MSSRSVNSRYGNIIENVKEQIRQKIWLPGERIPSVRVMSKAQAVSVMTVLKAYEHLEAEGWIYAKAKAGYYVAAHFNRLSEPEQATPQVVNRSIHINRHVFEVLRACKRPDVIPFGSAFPDPELFPLQQLGRTLAQTIKTMPINSGIIDLPPGSLELRRAIAQRYLRDGIQVSLDDIVITSGAMESLGLSLAAVTQPGDTVAVESPAFYGALQAIERLRLKAVEIPTHPRKGMSVDALKAAIETNDVKACWLMSKFQNPLGATMAADQKQAIYDLLATNDIPLIEDDVYAELYFGKTKPLPIKALDEKGLILHSSSFSKCLAPGFRVGWVAAGRYARQVEELQFMSTLSVGAPNQFALTQYIQHGGYDNHLRRLRRTLEQRQQQMLGAIEQFFPEGTKVTRPEGGYFLWVELPKNIDTSALLTELLDNYRISIAPGTLFSGDQRYKHCMRINCAYPWDEHNRAALCQLAKYLTELCDQN
ncbi:PLP-dependent aminotransferase family protein [Photobacterium sp. OFAV2-7]|uniref:aminotransferase-like domain-containing protein n=1 Tax=Photobacterium sp. OFAV2-7 TaxID=2917748 RepID=UPI001EF4E125|nr:PLP-dependent aminotransferase family protein [Photobacterium sp. OFAV2-7]MCG7584762.1 PLP-dependent aminotransferase family protein [Photobacterium sp. OFAV2-7]